MFNRGQLLLISSLLVANGAQAALRVHEWGTFTSMVGSDGVAVNGMFHEDEVLPDFVHGLGEVLGDNLGSAPIENCGKGVPRPCTFLREQGVIAKMETPVVYFYSDESLKVSVDVDFPMGVISQTFPAPVESYPNSQNLENLNNGRARFEVDVLLGEGESIKIPFVAADNIYSHARNVSSNIIRSGSEYERFIFYRGLGQFKPDIRIESGGGALSIAAAHWGTNISDAFLVHADKKGRVRLFDIGPINAGSSGHFTREVLMDFMDHSVKGDYISGEETHPPLLKALANAGLYNDEAQAMIDTWDHGYFKTPGLRLLYILPRSEVESILPMTITPKPQRLERAFVGRVEILLDTQENELISDIRHARDLFDVNSLGRFAEPILQRLRAKYVTDSVNSEFGTKPEVVALFDRLIERTTPGLAQ